MSTRFIILFMTISMVSTIGCSNSSSKSSDPSSIPVSGVTVKSSTSLVVGATEQLSASIQPADASDKGVSWSSDTESIVTVSDGGLITGKAVGSAKITVTTDDGAKTAICNVTVSATAIPVTGVTLNKSTLSLVIGSNDTLIPTILPVNATNQNTSWKSNSPDIADVDAFGKVSAKAIGEARITVTTNDGNKSDYCDVTVIPVTAPQWPISGNINLLDNNILNSSNPYKFSGEIDFGSNPYDDSDFDSLSSGGKKLITDGNMGGTSILSEVFAFEVLRTTIGAQLLKSETEIVYTDPNGKQTNFLIQVDSHKIGVVVVRGYIYPPESDYTVTAAQTLLTNKLSKVNQSTANVTSADSWEKQILFVMAYSSSIATSFDTAWANIDNTTKGNTILVITTTNGDDSFIYAN